MATQVEVLWHTDEVRSVRPRVLDEVGNALFYLERTFFDAIPDVRYAYPNPSIWPSCGT